MQAARRQLEHWLLVMLIAELCKALGAAGPLQTAAACLEVVVVLGRRLQTSRSRAQALPVFFDRILQFEHTAGSRDLVQVGSILLQLATAKQAAAACRLHVGSACRLYTPRQPSFAALSRSSKCSNRIQKRKMLVHTTCVSSGS